MTPNGLEKAKKLTEAQARILRSVADGAVARHFDVYGGYWWEDRGKRLPGYGKSGNFPPLPIRYLLQSKLIVIGQPERPYSGRTVETYDITPLGLTALQQIEDQK